MSEPRYSGGSEARGKKLREAVERNLQHPDQDQHYAWLWWCPACGAPHQCDKRWTFDGNMERPTFAPSVLVTADWTHEAKRRGSPDRCHTFVRAGQIQFLSDCTHKLAGQTVDLPDWPWTYGGKS